MIAIVDYGMGNLRSVQKGFEKAGFPAIITSSPSDLSRAQKLVFPGVGAFGAAMKELKKRRLISPIKKGIKEGKPFLGLCLGLQLLFEESEEAKGIKGLGILPGKVLRFRFPKDKNLKIPHMGWNRIDCVPAKRDCPLLAGIPAGAFMYFVHSYYVSPEEKDVILTATEYGIKFTSGIWKGNLYATQFHPEKSQDTGLSILKNFGRL